MAKLDLISGCKLKVGKPFSDKFVFHKQAPFWLMLIMKPRRTNNLWACFQYAQEILFHVITGRYLSPLKFKEGPLDLWPWDSCIVWTSVKSMRRRAPIVTYLERITQSHRQQKNHVHACKFASVMFDCAILWTLAYQAALAMGLSRQEYWRGLLFPSPGDLPGPGIKPAWQMDT